MGGIFGILQDCLHSNIKRLVGIMNGGNYLFVFIKKILKKINLIWENTEGSLRQISRDKLADERTKLPLRFF
jgi:hypothetical protein